MSLQEKGIVVNVKMRLAHQQLTLSSNTEVGTKPLIFIIISKLQCKKHSAKRFSFLASADAAWQMSRAAVTKGNELNEEPVV